MLGRNASTDGREIKRNTWFPSNENESCRPYRPKRLKTGPWTGGCYIAGRRRAEPRRRYRLSCERLWARVAERLRRGPPLPVSGRLRVLFPDDSAMRVCPETVCRWIYADRHRRECWARRLPRGHGRRRRRGGGRTSRFPIPGRVPISERPSEAGDRSGFGHWEADGVIGAGCNPHTEVERKTRFLMARIVPGRTAGESVGAQLAMFSPLPAGARRRHARQRHRVRPPHAPARRAGHGHVLRRPVLQPAAGKQRKQERHDPPVSVQTQRDPDGHGRGTAGDCRRGRQPSHARARLPDAPAEAFADELLELQDQQGCCTSK